MVWSAASVCCVVVYTLKGIPSCVDLTFEQLSLFFLILLRNLPHHPLLQWGSDHLVSFNCFFVFLKLSLSGPEGRMTERTGTRKQLLLI